MVRTRALTSRGERFGNIIVSTNFQPHNSVQLFATGCQEDHGQIGAAASIRRHRSKPLISGKPTSTIAKAGEPLLSAARAGSPIKPPEGKPFAFQRINQRISDTRFIFYQPDQWLHHIVPSSDSNECRSNRHSCRHSSSDMLSADSHRRFRVAWPPVCCKCNNTP